MNTILIPHLQVCPPRFKHRALMSLGLACLLLGFGTGLSSCATARGFGADVEHVGEEIQEGVSR